MKKTNKQFDCVAMKWTIQKKIASRYKGISEDRSHQLQEKNIANNPILGPYLKKIRARHSTYHFNKAA